MTVLCSTPLQTIQHLPQQSIEGIVSLPGGILCQPDRDLPFASLFVDPNDQALQVGALQSSQHFVEAGQLTVIAQIKADGQQFLQDFVLKIIRANLSPNRVNYIRRSEEELK